MPSSDNCGILISIHAPTGGATVSPLCFCALPVYFNPRSHGGSDLFFFQNILYGQLFQSTLPRGERHPLSPFFTVFGSFQSTLPRGERQLANEFPFLFYPISIHAPTGGATQPNPLMFVSSFNFNPRSHGGSDSKSHQI